MIFHTQSNHDWSVTPELAVLLCVPRPARRFWRSMPAGNLDRRWFCRPD